MKRFQFAILTILLIAGCNTKNIIPEPQRNPLDPSLVRLKYHLGKGKALMMNKLEKKYHVVQKKYGNGGRFYNEDHSFTYFYEGDKLVKLLLSVQQPVSHLRAYTGKLPFGLLRRDTYDSVVKKLGPPSSKIMDKTILKYDDKKITIYFLNGTISAIYLLAD